MSKKNYFLLLASQLFSILGTGMIQFALALYVLDQTQSAMTFSVIASLAIIGRIISLPFCGVLADHLPKKKLLVAMDFSYLVLALGLITSTLLVDSIVPIGVILIVLGLVSAFETPVVQSAIPLLCTKKEIPKANGAVSTVGILGNIIAPILGGMLYNFEKVYHVFIVSVCLFAIAILCEWLLELEERPLVPSKMTIRNILTHDLEEVKVYLKEQPLIVQVCGLAFILNFLLASFIQIMIPFIARVLLNVSNQQFGLMNMSFAIGGLIGAVLYSVAGPKLVKISLSYLLNNVAVLFLLLIIPLSVLKNERLAFYVMVGIVTLVLAIVTMVSVQLIVFIQLVTEQSLLGRVMSFVVIVSTLATPLGQVMYGALGNHLTVNGMVLLIVIISVLTIVMSFIGRKTFSEIQRKTLLVQRDN